MFSAPPGVWGVLFVNRICRLGLLTDASNAGCRGKGGTREGLCSLPQLTLTVTRRPRWPRRA